VCDENRPAREEGRMRMCMSVPSYKMVYEGGSEELVVRMGREDGRVVERAAAREAERRRSLFLE
jgi:hypothetical protein